jgi:alkylated DNA nucleotide flippase Atl1
VVRAVETSLQELLEGSKQYQVPLYQRTYSWQRAQLERLWEDVAKLAADRVQEPAATHFVGSVVLAPSPGNGPAGVAQYLVVDGQQRLTTLSVLLIALRDHQAETDGPGHRDRINEQFLINKWKDGQQRLKLSPTQADRPAYLACLDSTPDAGGTDRIGSAYRFFRSRLQAIDDPDDPSDIQHLEDAIISGLSLVSVTAQGGDNAYRIFESLNNTGLKLSQGDLLRNYLFMRLPTRSEIVYQSLWLPMQAQLDTDHLEQLFWLDLAQSNPRVKQTEIYAGQQKRLETIRNEAGIEEEVARFARLAAVFRLILDPVQEKDPEVARRLRRLNEWGATTVRPLVLHLLHRRDRGSASSGQVAQALQYVESFLVRRLLVGRATNGLNRILMAAVTEMPADVPVDEAVRRYLSTGRKSYAADAELQAGIRSIPFYLNGRPHQRALVLRWLEESYGSKEPVDPAHLTIEHLLPQTPTQAWRDMLREDLEEGEVLEEIYEALLHTLGNLTLTGYNAPLSNKPFAEKRAKLAVSGLEMNKDIAGQGRWGRPQIMARADALAARARELWPGPVSGTAESGTEALWTLMNQALAAMPRGTWTTYGDVAALIGTHPVPVGQRLASHPAPGAHRVLQAEGTVSPGFRWLDAACTDDPRDVLQEEGIRFGDHGRADQNQRLTVEDLARLAGLAPDEPYEAIPDPEDGGQTARRDRFLGQLATAQPAEVTHGVITLLGVWTQLGGSLGYGQGSETSCFLLPPLPDNAVSDPWPLTVYPSGRCEVVFQHMLTRPPYDDAALREELRGRLNAVGGIDLPAGKLEMRPGFPLSVLASEPRLLEILRALCEFIDRVWVHYGQPADWAEDLEKAFADEASWQPAP